jgi:hypothetical protein
MTADGRIAPQVSWDRRNEFTLAYDNKDSKWTLADIKKYDKSKKDMVEGKLADDEELNQDSLNELRNALDDLQIADVVRKPSGLSADLKAGAEFLNKKEAIQDLIEKGFSPVPLKPGADPEILSSEGEVVCTLRDGVEYVLRFGQLQIQTESAGDTTEPASPGETASAVEKGKSAKAGEPSKAADAKDAKPGDKKEGDKKDSDLRRYLFVMARFNKDIIEKPKLKELPAAPAAEKPAAGESASAGGSPAGGDEPAAANKSAQTHRRQKRRTQTRGAERPKAWRVRFSRRARQTSRRRRQQKSRGRQSRRRTQGDRRGKQARPG